MTPDPQEPLRCSKCGKACVKRGPLKHCTNCGFEERIEPAETPEDYHPRRDILDE
jgi:hypothetical protein